jgi:hypothetical protein
MHLKQIVTDEIRGIGREKKIAKIPYHSFNALKKKS